MSKFALCADLDIDGSSKRFLIFLKFSLLKLTFISSCFITKYQALFSELLNEIPIISSSNVFNPVVSVSKEK